MALTPALLTTVFLLAAPPAEGEALACPNSLRAHVVEVRTSSSLPPWKVYHFGPWNLLDGDLATSWQPQRKPKPWIFIGFDAPVDITELVVANGFHRQDALGDLFALNSRIKRASIELSDGSSREASFGEQDRAPARITIGKTGVLWLRLTAEETWKGKKWPDLAVSELAVCGEPSHKPAAAASNTSSVTLTVGPLKAEAPRALPPPSFALATFPALPSPPRAPPLQVKWMGEVEGWRYLEKMVSEDAVPLLRKNQFVVDLGGGSSYQRDERHNVRWREFFEAYEANRYHPLLIETEELDLAKTGVLGRKHWLSGMPSVITPDVALHTFHLFFDFLLATAEENAFAPTVLELSRALLGQTERQLAALAGTAWESAVRDNQVFLAVGYALLRSSSLVNVAPEAQRYQATEELVEQLRQATLEHVEELLDVPMGKRERERAILEIRRVVAAKETARPTLFAPPESWREDYSQYEVRGHYVKTARLQAYFRAMLWFSRIPFALSSDSALRSAAALSIATANCKNGFSKWQGISDTIGFLIGPPNDVTFSDLLPVLARLGERALDDPAQFAAFKAACAALRPPQVQGVATKADNGPALETLKSFHFFSQRSVPDAVLMQQLVDPIVRDRFMLSALEVPALMGSERALTHLPETTLGYPGWQTQAGRLSRSFPALVHEQKDRVFYTGWLFALAPFWQPVPEGMPTFMKNEAYANLRLNTSMASWAELKHDTALYGEQVIAEDGGPGFEIVEKRIDVRGYVVPEIQTYQRLQTLMSMLRRGLQSKNLFPASLNEPTTRFENLLSSLVEISRKELADTPRTDEEYRLIEFIGGDLAHFWSSTLIGISSSVDNALDDNNAQLIADVFTHRNEILHVATGNILPVFVIFPLDGRAHLGRGGVMSYYELILNQRTGDSEWRQMLESAPPGMPAWADSFKRGTPCSR